MDCITGSICVWYSRFCLHQTGLRCCSFAGSGQTNVIIPICGGHKTDIVLHWVRGQTRSHVLATCFKQATDVPPSSWSTLHTLFLRIDHYPSPEWTLDLSFLQCCRHLSLNQARMSQVVFPPQLTHLDINTTLLDTSVPSQWEFSSLECIVIRTADIGTIQWRMPHLKRFVLDGLQREKVDVSSSQFSNECMFELFCVGPLANLQGLPLNRVVRWQMVPEDLEGGGVEYLERLTELRHLDVGSSYDTDNDDLYVLLDVCLEKIGTLSKLETLNFYGVKGKSVSFAHLAHLNQVHLYCSELDIHPRLVPQGCVISSTWTKKFIHLFEVDMDTFFESQFGHLF